MTRPPNSAGAEVEVIRARLAELRRALDVEADADKREKLAGRFARETAALTRAVRAENLAAGLDVGPDPDDKAETMRELLAARWA